MKINLLRLLFVALFLFNVSAFANIFTDTIKEKYQVIKADFLQSVYSNDNSKSQNDKKNYDLYNTKFQNGKITTLSDSVFDRSNSKDGLWLPTNFIKNIGGGLYMFDKYDNNKIPILFVHGAGGNPREWSDIVHSLDLKKYQPIFAYYASGLSISLNSDVIREHLNILISQHNIKNLIVVAHSMGGLLSRSLIGKLNQTHNDLVQLFISISTPWGGFDGAENSSKLFFRLPLWVDMDKDGKYITSLRTNDYLNGVEHYLFYGYLGKESLFNKDTKNDGVVTIESQLSPYAVKNAKKVFGFNETHTSILISQDVLLELKIILNDKYK